MIEISIPGGKSRHIEHLVLDYNGTLALNGSLLPGVADRIKVLSDRVAIHVVTADTFGVARKHLEGLPVTLQVLEQGQETLQKQRYVEALGPAATFALGNGANDAAMLKAAGLGVCVIGSEGCSPKAMQAADLLVRSIQEGLELLMCPKRITATLRE